MKWVRLGPGRWAIRWAVFGLTPLGRARSTISYGRAQILRYRVCSVITMDKPAPGDNWIVDEETHSSEFSYLQTHLGEQNYKLGGVPFEKYYSGYISPNREILIVAGEVKASSYDTNTFMLLAGSLWEIHRLKLGSKVPSWTFPVEGGVDKAKGIASDLRLLVERTDSDLNSLSEFQEVRNCIYDSDGRGESSDKALVERYLTDYLISVQWDDHFPETAWGCSECGSPQMHEAVNGVAFHVIKGNGGFFYPYRMWCPEHSISGFDDLEHQIPPNSEIEGYFKDTEGGQDSSSNIEEKMRYYTLSSMIPVERQYIIQCDLDIGNFDRFRRFLSITDPTVLVDQ